MITAKSLYDAIPELMRISDSGLRKKCVSTMSEALSLGGWTSLDSLEETPVILHGKSPMAGRLSFIREVVALASDEYDEIIDWVSELAPCEKNVILAGALLADIGLYVRSGPNPPANAEYYNQAEWAAYLAQKHELPEKIVYVLLTRDPVMAPEGAKAIFINEVRFVRSAYYILLEALSCTSPVDIQ